MRYILNSLMVFLTILFVGMAYPRIVHASDIITPELLTRYKPGSIRWGMPKAKVKKILLKRERQPLIESSCWLILTKSNHRTKKYAFTDDDKLAFVEHIQTVFTNDATMKDFEIYVKLMAEFYGAPSQTEPEWLWETPEHGFLITTKTVSVEDDIYMVYSISYDKKLYKQYLEEQTSY